MAVPFYNHARIYQRRKAEIDTAILGVLASGRLDWGDHVPAFEAEFAAFVGASHAVTVNSGTAALKVALMALGIGPGDEVITVSNTDIGTVSAIHHVGATSIWVDVDAATLCMDVAQARAAITPRTRAILPVDMFGHPAALVELAALAKEMGLALVEDACLALGGEINGQRLGTFADVTCFSFAPTKHLGSIGSGGACVTEDATLAERIRKLSAYGQDRARHRAIGGTPPPLHHETEGLNERMDELQAAVLRVKLPDVPASLDARNRQAAYYSATLSDIMDVPTVQPGARHAFRNYVVHLDDRDRMRAGLAQRGIGTALSYAPPMHLQPVYALKGFTAGSYQWPTELTRQGFPTGLWCDSRCVEDTRHAESCRDQAESYARRASPVGGVGQEREPEPTAAVDRSGAGRDEPDRSGKDRRHGPADAQGLGAPVQ